MTDHDKPMGSGLGWTGSERPASEYLRPPAAAIYCGLSESKLAKMRMRFSQSKGPRYLKIGSVVMYRRSELDAWLDSHIVEVD
ncbi:helix-turn-helix transcriptional regulator [Solirhodobacter olei]|uniref:helix-turn-helix transcriptional regulator n=1 Tax=Solirhodobacter olei TaxID=2493082 RepID=UPI0019D471E7|nr:hypothetical protein [Solirhodobacter olei]